MSNISKMIRPELMKFQPYDYQRPHEKGMIWLDHNESPWLESDDVNRYPNQRPAMLIQKLADYYQTDPKQILYTRGSDEAIDLLIRLMCRPYQDNVIICPPTFSMYAFSANVQGAFIIEAPLQSELDFSVNVDAIKQQITPNTKIIFFCSPNNPTGTIISPPTILSLAEYVNEQALIVIDEAYLEFSEQQSLIAQLSQYSNIVILRTLSKAFGLAGLRFGVLLGNHTLIQYLRAIMAPYPFSAPSLTLAELAFTPAKLLQLQQRVDYIKYQREWLFQQLQALSGVEKVWPSEANFLLVKIKDAKKISQYLVGNKIIVRDFSDKKGLENCIRLSVGLEEQNKRLIDLIGHYE